MADGIFNPDLDGFATADESVAPPTDYRLDLPDDMPDALAEVIANYTEPQSDGYIEPPPSYDQGYDGVCYDDSGHFNDGIRGEYHEDQPAYEERPAYHADDSYSGEGGSRFMVDSGAADEVESRWTRSGGYENTAVVYEGRGGGFEDEQFDGGRYDRGGDRYEEPQREPPASRERERYRERVGRSPRRARVASRERRRERSPVGGGSGSRGGGYDDVPPSRGGGGDYDREPSRDTERSSGYADGYAERDRGGRERSHDRRPRERRDRYDDDEGYRGRRHRSRDNERDSYRRRDDDRRRGDASVINPPPSPTVIAQNLTAKSTEEEIEDILRRTGFKALSVQIIRDKNGDAKGFGFIEFKSIKDAEEWLNHTKRQITVDGKPVYLNFSKPKYYEPTPDMDWRCTKCNALNYWTRRRSYCYECGTDKEVRRSPDRADRDEKRMATDNEPCNVLMLRGMDFVTTEEKIRSVIAFLTPLPVYDVRLIMDKSTGLSRGFCFVELGSTEDATKLLKVLEDSQPPVEIEGKKVSFGFARHGYNNAPVNRKKLEDTELDRVADRVLPKADKAKQSTERKYDASVALAQGAASQLRAPHKLTQSGSAHATAANSGHMFPDQVRQTDNGEHQYGSVPGMEAYQETTEPYLNQAPSDVSTYTYDTTSGYYYDSATGLYYDANSGYYYNGHTGQFLYWDGAQYVAVNQDGTVAQAVGPHQQTSSAEIAAPAVLTAAGPEEAPSTASQKKELDDPNKVVMKTTSKEAKRIAKDMERWAKKTNVQHEAKKLAVMRAQEELNALEAHEDALRRKILEETLKVGVLAQHVEQKTENIRSMFVPDNDEEGSVLKLGAAAAKRAPRRTAAVAAVVQEDPAPDEDAAVNERKFVNMEKKACLLCKRGFPTAEALMKHVELSQLHQQNVELYKKGQSVKTG